MSHTIARQRQTQRTSSGHHDGPRELVQGRVPDAAERQLVTILAVEEDEMGAAVVELPRPDGGAWARPPDF